VAGSTVSRHVSNAGRSIYWSPPVLPGRCQLEHGQVALDVGLSAWELDGDALAGQPRRCSRTWAFQPATRSSFLVTHGWRLRTRWVSTLGVIRHLLILSRDVLPGGAKGARTPDPLLAKQVLFQLSYSPEMSSA
jgi:hypothetical protein